MELLGGNELEIDRQDEAIKELINEINRGNG
jgi:hypothetical protein